MPNTSKYVQIFTDDSRKELGEMNHILLKLEKDKKNSELINALFRKTHSLKGMAATMGYHRLSELSHGLEEPLNKVREGKAELTSELIDLLFEGVDLLENLVEEAITESTPDINYQGFISKLKGQTDSEVLPPAKDKPVIKYQPPKRVLVDTRALDELINVVGEMIIHRNRLIELNRPLSSYELVEEMEILEDLVRGLYNQVLKIRMMPVSTATDLLYRIVRDLASNQGKEVDLKVEGDKEINLDRTILEELMDPLIHLIRNAVDHGIEPPQARKKRGKPRGKISLRFSKERDMIKVVMEDDGQGIDLVRVKEKALEKGIINDEILASLSEEDILMLLCEPGFSTSRTVTDVSGRGVGLDVVKNRVETLGGSMYILSEYGTSSKFILKIPATTHIIFALLIKLDSRVFAIPIPKILATTKINLRSTHNSFIFQENQVSLVRLGDLLEIEDLSQEEKGPSPVVVVETGGNKLGLIVDELLRIEQIFVKPLGKPLNKIGGLYGVTILGDGSMVLVLDVERLR